MRKAKSVTAEKNPATKRATKVVAKKAPVVFNEWGLRSNLEYQFQENGMVDWRKMIPDEHILLNREKFLKKENPVDVESLSKEEFQELKAKAREEDLIIKLTGYRELASIRGFSSVEEKLVYSSPDFVSVECKITWFPNYETNMLPVTHTGTADAHIGNCSKDFGANYLTAIASNRAFGRAVRNFLRVYIVSQDEIAFEKPEEASTSISAGPASALEDKIGKLGLTFDEFKEKLSKVEEHDFTGAEAWKSPKDVPSKYFPLIFVQLSRWK
jgi:hypothetical protein